MSMRDRFYDVLTELVRDDDRLAVVLGDIGVSRLPDLQRIVNVGIREQLMIGVASGLALEGLRPVAHSYAPFLVERPFEQIKLDFGHQGVGAVLVSVGASYDASTEGRTHQAPEDVALLANLPGWAIHVPGHEDEMEHQLRTAVRGDGCVYIRLDARSNREPHHSESVVVVERGSPGAATVLAVGPMLDPVVAALDGADVTIAYTATVRPLDGEGLRVATESEADLVVVEPYLEGTSHHAVSVALGANVRRVFSVGYQLRESRRYGTPQDHLRDHGLDPAGLSLRLRGILDPPA